MTTAINTRPITASSNHPTTKRVMDIRTFDTGTEFYAKHLRSGKIEVRVQGTLFTQIYSPIQFAAAFNV